MVPLPWLDFRDCPCQPFLVGCLRGWCAWVLNQPLTVLRNSRFAPLLTILVLVSGALLAQLTTGPSRVLYATRTAIRWPTRRLSSAARPVFHTVVQSNSNGEFSMTLPYGRYRLSREVQLFVGALQTIHIGLVIDASGTIRAAQPIREPQALGQMRRKDNFTRRPPACRVLVFEPGTV